MARHFWPSKTNVGRFSMVFLVNPKKTAASSAKNTFKCVGILNWPSQSLGSTSEAMNVAQSNCTKVNICLSRQF